MNVSTLITMHPDDLKVMLMEILKQASGNNAGYLSITPDDLPTVSAADAATILGCSVSKFYQLVADNPEHIRPIFQKKKAARYSTEQIIRAKNNNLLKKK